MHDLTARPLQEEAQRVLETVFKRLLDTAYATTHLGFVFTTDEQLYAEQLIVEAFNRDAKRAGWDVRLVQFGPALPDALYTWNGWHFRPASPGDVYVEERWRRLGRKSPIVKGQEIPLHLFYQSAKRNGVVIPELQGPIVSKPGDGIGWALEYRPVGGLHLAIGDTKTIKLKRGEWLSDAFVLLWLSGELETTRSNRFRHHVSQRWDRVLRKRAFWQNFAQVFRMSVTELELAWERHEQALRDIRELSKQPIYRKPPRPSNWNLRDYSEKTNLRLKNGKYERVDRQKGGPVRYPIWDVVHQLIPPETQRLLERIGRLYKEDYWHPWRDEPCLFDRCELKEKTDPEWRHRYSHELGMRAIRMIENIEHNFSRRCDKAQVA